MPAAKVAMDWDRMVDGTEMLDQEAYEVRGPCCTSLQLLTYLSARTTNISAGLPAKKLRSSSKAESLSLSTLNFRIAKHAGKQTLLIISYLVIIYVHAGCVVKHSKM